jgi:hypothetical protein
MLEGLHRKVQPFFRVPHLPCPSQTGNLPQIVMNPMLSPIG